ncbi:fungal-specific transcription factor domain-containing protein [Mariannaea sp. PMI_226]|nr:fungal-specific transcription factor domain-containing protein [Mariannaea sp. PMI_226]
MASSPPPRHKRRKASCKEFPCTHEGCGRTYSRAEHLQRHQLNHSPKEIYYCDYPGCSFSFVRKDLYARHKLRHERQIQQFGNGRLSQRPSSTQREFTKMPRHRPRYTASEDGSTWSDTQDDAKEGPSNSGNADKTNDEATQADLQRDTESSGTQLTPSQGNEIHEDVHERQLRSRESSTSPDKQPLGSLPFHMDGLQNGDISMAIPSPDMGARPDQARNPSSFVMQSGLTPGHGNTLLEEQPFGVSPSSTDEFTSWLFNGQGINSGYSVPPGSGFGGMSSYSNNFGQLCPEYPTQAGMLGGSFMEPMNLWFQSETIQMSNPVIDISQLGKIGMSEHKRQSLIQYMMQRFNEIGSQGTKSATDIKNEIFGTDSESDSHVLSLVNVQRYINSYWENFHDQLPILHRPTFVPETAHDFLLLAVLIMGASMLKKNAHPAGMMDKISKFTTFVSWNLRWQVFMHADSHPPAKLWVIQTLLILEVYEKLNATRVLHERAHIYFPTTLSLMRRGSALTGKQSSYASRVPSPMMSPRLGGGPRLPSAVSSRREFDPSSPEKWWDHWIAQEATRRAAIAAFIIDATHAALFGHTPTLVIHEIKIPLPCDNTLWSSDSPSEIGCVESSLHANGVTPVTFLDGLQKTLNGQKVRTSPFGRIALLAALLSVTWQMHQRDLDRSTLGTDTIPGVQERWRPKLLRAFDWWKKDYDDGIAHVRHAAFDWQRLGLSSRGGSDDGDAIQTLGTVLYHLGHITVYISMPELCIFAGVPQILGRTVTSLDWRRTEAKIKEWVASPGAIGGVYHALQLVKLILLQENLHQNALGEATNFNPPPYPTYDAGNDNLLNRAWALYYASLVLWAYGYVQDGSLEPFPENLQYPSDSLPVPRMTMKQSMHSSSSGTSLAQDATSTRRSNQGPLSSSLEDESLSLSPDFETVKRNRHEDLKTYLQIMIPPTINSIKAFHVHQNQAGVVGNRNKIIGLLSVVDEALSTTNWELLMEARHRLRMAASMMKNPGEPRI